MSYDLSKLLVDFTTCPADEKLVDHFPQLSVFEEFLNAENEDYIRIAIATADPESPFTKIKERDLMLTALFAFLNLPRESPKEKKFYDEVLQYQHAQVLGCYAAYLKVCHDIDWTEYQTTKQTYDVLISEANRPKDKDEQIDNFVKRRMNIQGHLKKVGADLKAIEAKIFPDSRAAREIAAYENKRIKTFAEQYAEANTYI